MTYRDDRALCPTCGAGLATAGTRRICESCHGLLVSWQEVEEMLHDSAPDDISTLDQRVVPGRGTRRPCPLCAAQMVLLELDTVTIDRCNEHGLWFDGGELANILEGEAFAFGRRNPRIGRSPNYMTAGEALQEASDAWSNFRDWLRAKFRRKDS